MKKIALLLLFAMLMTTLCACTNGDAVPSSDVPSISEEAIVSSTPEPVSEPNSEPENEIKLNLDLLSDFGQTYSQIAAKRGEKIGVGENEGGLSYYFKNGYGGYGWGYDSLDYGSENAEKRIPMDKNGYIINETAPLPKSDIPCFYIHEIQAKDLFTNEFQSINISDINNLDKLEYLKTSEYDITPNFNYMSDFLYGEIEIHLYHHDEGKIDLNSEVSLRQWQGPYDNPKTA